MINGLQFISEPDVCAYLPEHQSRMEYRIFLDLDPLRYQELMDDGCRKFGAVVFRPVCRQCAHCCAIRVSVPQFTPDRSQRRAWRRNAGLRMQLSSPTADKARLELYSRYHHMQSARKHWPRSEVDAGNYISTFVDNPVSNVELTLWEEQTLRAVMLLDITPATLSAIYHYYEPEQLQRGLGSALILHTLHLAQRLSKKWVYLGYYVQGCRSMEYKARYRPCQLLRNGQWQAFNAQAAAQKPKDDAARAKQDSESQ